MERIKDGGFVESGIQEKYQDSRKGTRNVGSEYKDWNFGIF